MAREKDDFILARSLSTKLTRLREQYEAKRAALIAEAPEGVRAMLLARGELTAEEAQCGQGFDLTPEKLDAIGRELSRIQG